MDSPISGTVEKSADGNVIKETFAVNESGVQAVRNEIPVGVGGQPIARIPWHEKGERLVNAGTYIKRVGNQEICLRPIMIPLKGGTEGKFHCSMPCLSSGTGVDKYCPDHDKEAFTGPQTAAKGRVINSASIELSAGEKQVHYTDKDGKKIAVNLEEGRDVAAVRRGVTRDLEDSVSPAKPERRQARRTSAAPRRSLAPKGQSIVVRLTIEELGAENLVDNLRNRIVAAINALPARSVADMENVIAVRERVKQELSYQEEGK
jgi:hypothetical protein